MGTVEESSAYLPEVFIMGRFNDNIDRLEETFPGTYKCSINPD